MNGARKKNRGRTPIPSSAKNLAESVFRVLKSDIFEFRLLPGTRFSENEVAARTRVLRLALKEP